jgi:hypothetical protein
MTLRTEYAFRHLNLHKLKSGAIMDNEPSKRALQRAGYRQVGVEREESWRDGRWRDHWLCEVLRDDWEREHRHAVWGSSGGDIHPTQEVGEGRSSDPDFLGRLTPLTYGEDDVRVSSEFRELCVASRLSRGVYL